MYSLTISFGPSATVWAFLFKDENKAKEAFASVDIAICKDNFFRVEDDFGQIAVFGAGIASGVCFENLDQTEAARIQRSLAEERCKVKLMEAAKNDPVIGAAIRRQQGAPVLTPMGGFRQ
jgi:hypothetical protein